MCGTHNTTARVSHNRSPDPLSAPHTLQYRPRLHTDSYTHTADLSQFTCTQCWTLSSTHLAVLIEFIYVTRDSPLELHII